jgi:four helix bundle protein
VYVAPAIKRLKITHSFGRRPKIKLTKLAKRLPIGEKFLLANQMIRAARSITNNIAEGYGRYHYLENIQYCRQGRGSLYESIDHLTVCLDDEYIATEEFQILRSDCLKGIQIVNGYIRFLEKQKDVNRKSNDVYFKRLILCFTLCKTLS